MQLRKDEQVEIKTWENDLHSGLVYLMVLFDKLQKYLDKLKDYCEFEPIFGGVEIYLDTYNKSLKKDNDVALLSIEPIVKTEVSTY